MNFIFRHGSYPQDSSVQVHTNNSNVKPLRLQALGIRGTPPGDLEVEEAGEKAKTSKPRPAVLQDNVL